MILATLRLYTLSQGSDANRFSGVGRANDAMGGTGLMAVKPTDSTVAQVCRVCGGEVNPHGECVGCGHKQASSGGKAQAKGLGGACLRAELESMRETLNRELANFRTGRFDPIRYIEETANLSKQLQTEIAKRKELEQEIEHIKKGSIAVIKYVKSQQLKAGSSLDARKRLDQEVKARQSREAQVADIQAVSDQLRKQIDAGLAKMKPD